jgi:hypothetical protein
MAPTPFRRRGKLAKAAQNLALAEAALAFARARTGASSRKRKRGGRTLLIGGVAAAVAAGVFWKREKVAGLLPSRTGEYEPPAPGPSNYDVSGPAANTATPVPAPDPQTPQAVDEAAEEAAAAAEAANIGGPVSDYAGPTDLPAGEAERPLAEAGEGEAEGEEQTEFSLEQAAEPTAPGVSDSERQIEDTIESASNPAAGEQVEPVTPALEPEEPGAVDQPAPFDAPSGEEAEQTGGEKKPDDDDKDDGGDSDWQTWSGRSVNP